MASFILLPLINTELLCVLLKLLCIYPMVTFYLVVQILPVALYISLIAFFLRRLVEKQILHICYGISTKKYNEYIMEYVLDSYGFMNGWW